MGLFGYFMLCAALCLSASQEKDIVSLPNQEESSKKASDEKATFALDAKESTLYACPRCRRAQPPGPRKRPANQKPETELFC